MGESKAQKDKTNAMRFINSSNQDRYLKLRDLMRVHHAAKLANRQAFAGGLQVSHTDVLGLACFNTGSRGLVGLRRLSE
jgi:hypothetical protein